MKIIFNLFLRILNFFNFNKNYHNHGVMISYTHDIKKEDALNFEKIVQSLISTHNIISPTDFFNYLEKKSNIPEKSVLMTFDDGFLSSYQFAKTVLKKYNIKAIFFIPTKILELKTDNEMKNFTNNNIYFSKCNKTNQDEYFFANKLQLLDLINDGHYIAPHTHNHVIMKDLNSFKSIENELILPKKILNSFFPQERSVFAFPVGTERQVNKYIYNYIIENYNYCFTTLVGINTTKTNKYCLYRFNLPPTSSIKYLDSVLRGSYNSYYELKMRILKKKCNVR